MLLHLVITPIAFQLLKGTAVEFSRELFVSEYENHIVYKMQIEVKSYNIQATIFCTQSILIRKLKRKKKNFVMQLKQWQKLNFHAANRLAHATGKWKLQPCGLWSRSAPAPKHDLREIKYTHVT